MNKSIVCMNNINPQKIAVVTGASRGIGRAIAIRLAQDGFVVGVHYGSHSAAAAQTVSAIEEQGGKAYAFSSDLAVPDIGTQFWETHDTAALEAGIDPASIAVLVITPVLPYAERLKTLAKMIFCFSRPSTLTLPTSLFERHCPVWVRAEGLSTFRPA